MIVGNLVTIVPEKNPEETEEELTLLELEAVWLTVLEELVTLLLEEELEVALLLDEVVLLEVLELVSDPI
jgi:hypothetical protein